MGEEPVTRPYAFADGTVRVLAVDPRREVLDEVAGALAAWPVVTLSTAPAR